MKKATNQDKSVIRAIAKQHGVTGCIQPLHAVHVGKQGRFLDKAAAHSLVADLSANGFLVEPGYGDMVDVLLVWKAS